QLPPFENWDSPGVRGAAYEIPGFPLLERISVLKPSLFVALVKKLNPLSRSPGPLRDLIEKFRGIRRTEKGIFIGVPQTEMAAMPEKPKS
ncbi:MAG: hypothetical protein ACRC12_03420, partial [Holosporales bacterium]